MAAYTNTVYILIVLILICDIHCDTSIGNNGNNKLSQSSEKDSKVSQHENDGKNKVSLEESGINVIPKSSHDNLNVKHASPNDIKQPLESSLSDQGNREASSKSQSVDKIDHTSNNDSPSSVVPPDQINSDKVENKVGSLDMDSGDVLFEESGSPEESLVDQMKRLSEKIKERQNKESVEMEMPDNIEKKEIKLENKEIEELAEQGDDRLDENSEKTLNTGDKFEQVEIESKQFEVNRENIEDDKHDVNVQVNEIKEVIEQDSKETLMEQMKKLEKEVTEGEIDIPSLVPSYDNEHLPNEEELEEAAAAAEINGNVYNQDITGKSDEQSGKPSSELFIDNTQPPSSDILPSKTDEQINENINKQTNEQIQVRLTPSFENVKSTVQTMSQIDVTEQIQPTAKVDMKSSKKVLNAQERKNLRLAKNKRETDLDEKQIPAPVKTNVNPTPVHELNIGTQQSKEMSKEMTAAVDANSATEKEDIKTVSEELETSENDITGTVYDTNVFKEEVIQETLNEMTAETRENLAPTTTTGK
jgi:hypothetical protein